MSNCYDIEIKMDYFYENVFLRERDYFYHE